MNMAAAVRCGVTPSCLIKCFFRPTGKTRRGLRLLTDSEDHRFLRRSHLHTVSECITRPLLGRTKHKKSFWVSAVAVRHNSSQIPPDAGNVSVSESPPITDSSTITLPSDSTPVTAQPITEQIKLEAASAVQPASSAQPSVLDSPPDLLPFDITSVLPHTAVEQVTEALPTAVEVLQAAGTEPTLAELGLASYTPVGLIQNLLEMIHVDLGLPWWGAIIAGTVLARLAMFPVIVKGQRETAKMNNVLPEMTKLTERMNDAKRSGNKFEFARAYSDLMLFQKKHDVSPLRGFLVPLVQAPVFMSFFIGLRKMAYLPVPSLQTGGALWFSDLTVADPFYILPLAVTGTMFLILELGAESGVDNPNLRGLRTVFRIMPFVILPLTISFPTAVFTYWLTSNCFSLGQVTLLKHPWVRKKLKIPLMVAHPASSLPQNEGFIANIKKGWKNAELAQQLEERERRIKNHLDIAARGPLRQTFAHNPMQQTPAAATTTRKGKAVAETKPWKDTIG
ncbi:mitochondrial inner membrane protein OXA1L isoform X2 [Thalassophryne amazonica]|uniref:mitochondrial inner membrane protein OXA1L isoform X2 n=1 Tax=Thalassophryne amazonica TaxID=390379 RepID=UPI0014718EC3|nr:mitochondrial inner membrane protein OXA1L isoform X2 [Thalassophryne amazonica]